MPPPHCLLAQGRSRQREGRAFSVWLPLHPRPNPTQAFPSPAHPDPSRTQDVSVQPAGVRLPCETAAGWQGDCGDQVLLSLCVFVCVQVLSGWCASAVMRDGI